jgi:arabinogalactan endo-1,4-beta-galactosidase
MLWLLMLFTTVLYAQPIAQSVYLGVDLSSANQLDDCGVTFYDATGEPTDVFTLFADWGANMVRVRLWHTPQTPYNGLDDVMRTIRRAKAANMQVLLDYHYSDTWADPGNQQIPAAWAAWRDDLPQLENALYEYTYTTLIQLREAGLQPDMVQIGNETDTDILRNASEDGYPVDWVRMARLLNAGIQAVRAVDPSIQVMIHLAQAHHAVRWLEATLSQGLNGFDVIGLSYYPQWSALTLDELGDLIVRLRHRYDADVMIVEMAYPWTLEWNDQTHNPQGADALWLGYPATPTGQRDFLIDLTQMVLQQGGLGVIYWEPAWIVPPCEAGHSPWENATLLDFDGVPHAGMEFLSYDYAVPFIPRG